MNWKLVALPAVCGRASRPPTTSFPSGAVATLAVPKNAPGAVTTFPALPKVGSSVPELRSVRPSSDSAGSDGATGDRRKQDRGGRSGVLSIAELHFHRGDEAI